MFDYIKSKITEKEKEKVTLVLESFNRDFVYHDDDDEASKWF